MYLFAINLITGLPDASAAAPDEELVQRLVGLAREGDSLAARRLYRMYVGRLYRAVRPLAGTEADAEDVVQDTFVAALGSLGRYQRRPDKRFVSWLVTIALNTARTQARRTQRWRPLAPARLAALQESDAAVAAATASGEAAAQADTMAEQLDRQRLGGALLEALEELPERDRRIVVLRYGAELNASEIASLVGEEPATVRKICQRQRDRLLQRLQRRVPLDDRPHEDTGNAPRGRAKEAGS